MASTIAAITTGIGGIVTTADATGNLSLLSGTSTVVAVTSAGAAVTGTMSVSGATTLTGGLNTPLAVTSGGTGLGTLTANNVILGAGTSNPTFVAPSTTGNLLTSNGTTWTSAAAPAGGVTTFNGSTTGLTPATATSGAITLGGTLAVANGGTGSILGSTDKIQPITASVASSALTITLSPTVLDFRSATIGSGTVTTVSNSTSISVVVPSTATLGTVNAVQNRLVVLAINNAGTMELAVTNISGGSDLSETGVISTTLIAAASNSATLYYSTTARTSVAYRVVGYIQSTQATAGTWATAPSTIQGYGGCALDAMSSLGYGQTWQVVTRNTGTTYYNTTGKPIIYHVFGAQTVTGNSANVQMSINGGANIQVLYQYVGSTTSAAVGQILIPPSASYTPTYAAITILAVTELR